MTYILDPERTWERAWELANPEPDIKFLVYQDGKHYCTWSEMIAHVIWMQKRMEAYREFCREKEKVT